MSAGGDPIRLAASPEVPPAVRAVLRTAQEDGASSLQIQRLTERVETALLQPLPAPSAPGLASGALGKAAALCVGMAAGAGIAWLALGRPPLSSSPHPPPAAPTEQLAGQGGMPAPRPARADPAELDRRVEEPPSEPAEPPGEAVRPEREWARPTARSPVRPPPPEPSAHSTRETTSPAAPPSETELLDAARRALERAPAQALALTNAHRRHHPQGRLAQEREVLAIEALVALGQRAEARQRAAQLEARYPSSVYLRRVRHLVR